MSRSSWGDRGRALVGFSPPWSETVVHELAHARQDQHFDISRKSRFEEDALFDVVVEGDAQRIADAYVEDYSTTEFDEYFAIAEDFERMGRRHLRDP